MTVAQALLNGKPGISQDPEKPWKGICCEACWNAKGKRCRCRCGGAFHGIGRANGEHKRRSTRQPPRDPVLGSEQAQPFKQAITDSFCSCGCDISGEPIYYYEHDAGWKVKGIEKRQWLYIHCPECGNDLALWKLGVDREFGEGDTE